MSLKLNPIRVIDNGKIVRIVEGTKEFKNDSVTTVDIVTLSDVPIHSYEITDDLLIELDVNLVSVKLLYLNNNEYVDFEIIELEDKSLKFNELSEEEKLYEDLKLKIKQAMDMPDGTEVEVSKHTELLKRTTTDPNARVYVSSKIRKQLIKMSVNDELVEDLTYRLYAELYGMGVLQELDDDGTVGEIMVNARTFPKFSCDIYYIQNQVKKKYDKTFKTLPEMENVFRKVVEFSKKELNATDNAMVEATLHTKLKNA